MCNQIIFILPSLSYHIFAHQHFTNGNFSASHVWHIYAFDPFPIRRFSSASIPSTSHFYKALDLSLTITLLPTLQHPPALFVSHSLQLICLHYDVNIFSLTNVGYDFLFYLFILDLTSLFLCLTLAS